MRFSWLSPHSGSATLDNGETMTYVPTPHANNDLEKAIPYKGQEHEDSESLLAVRKVNTTRKVIVCSVALTFMLALLLLPVLFCGVFQEAKDSAEDHATGIVLQNSTVIPSSTSWSSKLL